MESYSSHELLWLSCAAKRCCSVRTVRPTGGDIWRIATQLQVPPTSFLRTTPADSSAGDGVLLASNGHPIYPALARRVVNGRQAACIFLMQVHRDAARCGLGNLRPSPCQSFPATGVDGILCISEQLGCTCRTWSIADLDRAVVSQRLGEEAAEREMDQQLIQAWNTNVVANAPTRYQLADFCDYLMHAYQQLSLTHSEKDTV